VSVRDSDHPANALLSVRGLTIPLPRGGDRPYAIRDISFDVEPREIVCVVGESGSGKSMTANTIMGLLPDYLVPQAGEIFFQGRDLLKLPEDTVRGMRGKDVAMIFQEPLSALNPVMKVGRQIAEVMSTHHRYPGEERNRRVLELLNFVGLPDPASLGQAYPFALSGGQRQRVMIAMALALEPALLIADEPTTALDVTTQAQILALISDIQRQKGMGVLFITHDFGVVAEIADRVVVMEKGRLVEQGPAAQVLNQPQEPYTRRLIAAVPRRRARAQAAAASGEPPLLEVRNLRKTYRMGRKGLFSSGREVHAVSGVSFQVQAGETLGIVGESGSGKSTIGKCLLRLIHVDGGEILFDGHDLTKMSQRQLRPLRKSIQMIFQDPFSSLNPRHTVGKIISDGPVANGMSRREAQQRAYQLLDMVGLDRSAFDRYPNQFSGGQRQRVGIARALALDPKVIVADESVSALDVSVQAQVLELLRAIQRRLNIAMIFITHDLRVAAQVCDRVAVMHRGAFAEYGEPAQIFDHPSDPYTQELIAAIPGKDWDPDLSVITPGGES